MVFLISLIFLYEHQLWPAASPAFIFCECETNKLSNSHFIILSRIDLFKDFNFKQNKAIYRFNRDQIFPCVAVTRFASVSGSIICSLTY